MLKKQAYLLAVLLLSLTACKTDSPKSSISLADENVVLVSIAGSEVSLAEFDYVFKKNNKFTKEEFSDSAINAYLNLYINFKLKVEEARHLGLDTLPKFISEFESYKAEITKPYLSANKATEELVTEAYERMKYEINASHILIRVSEDASPEDTLIAYNKIYDLYERVQKGEQFERLAREFSEDPSAQQNAGNLGWFSSMQMVYSFENAAYNTPIGEVSQPLRTRFGYHILKVHDKRNAQGKVKASHIMLRHKPQASATDSVELRKKAFQIYRDLEEGADWFQLCSQFSEDLNTKATGGTLPWIGSGQLVPEFEQVAFSLQVPGEISQPVQTAYGWHIIRLEDKRGVESFESMQNALAIRVQRDSRSSIKREHIIQKLKKENDYQRNEPVWNQLVQSLDSGILDNESWKVPELNLKRKEEGYLFKIGEQQYELENFQQHVNNLPNRINISKPAEVLTKYYDEYVAGLLFQYEEQNLDSKYSDYKYLVQEYKEGLLLFDIMEKEVWAKAVRDTLGLRAYFETNKEDYQWKQRAEVLIFKLKDANDLPTLKKHLTDSLYPVSRMTVSTKDKNAINYVVEQLKQQQSYYIKANERNRKALEKAFEDNGLSNSRIIYQSKGQEFFLSNSVHELEKNFNVKDPLNLSITKGVYELGSPQLPEQMQWTMGTQELTQDKLTYLIIIKNIIPAQNKSFDEAKGLVISDYQEHLEQEWLASLKQKYDVNINSEELKRYIKQANEQLAD